MTGPSAYTTWLRIAEEAARAGAAAIRSASEHGRSVDREEGREVKIAADAAAESAILVVLRDRSDFAILSEESGSTGCAHEDGAAQWIVDPLDGSFNYQRGLPLAAVSVALWRGNEPVLGVVLDLASDDLYTGIVGVGAWRNGLVIEPSITESERDCVICTGLPVSADYSDDALGGLVRFAQAFKKVRMIGSAALSLAYVACGRVDAYHEADIKLWDVAAGVALVRSAGGASTILPGRIPMTRMVTATNGRLSLTVRTSLGPS